ncbi:MAG TPA: hypothetical protein VGC65_11830 [Bacteroidia bacterium]
MKKTALLFCILFVSARSFGQSYLSLPNSSHWQMVGTDNDPGICNGYYRYHSSTEGDTIINAKTYLKIYGD